MGLCEEFDSLWSRMTEDEKKRAVLLLARRCDLTPLDGRLALPNIRVEFIKAQDGHPAKDGHDAGTNAVKGA